MPGRMATKCRGIADREHVVERLRKNKRHFLPQLLRQVVQIRLVPLRQDKRVDPRAPRGERLHLDATHREHLTAQRDLPGHRNVVANRNAGQQGHERDRHRGARRGPILRNRARRNVQVDVGLFEEILVDPEIAGPSTGRRTWPPSPTPS